MTTPDDLEKRFWKALKSDRTVIWLDGSSLVAGVRMLLGVDPRKDYAGKVAEVRLT